MRKQQYIAALVLGLMLLAQACYYDNPPKPLPIEPDDVSFVTHIQPIFKKSCALTDCHEGTKPPNLLPENSFRELNAGYINTLFPDESRLVRSIEYEGSYPMPPSGQLSNLDRDLIKIWIGKGAPND